jgi:hypothetical protein
MVCSIKFNVVYEYRLTFSDGKFPEIFTGGNFPYDVREPIFTCLFFTVISMFREIFTVLSMFL